MCFVHYVGGRCCHFDTIKLPQDPDLLFIFLETSQLRGGRRPMKADKRLHQWCHWWLWMRLQALSGRLWLSVKYGLHATLLSKCWCYLTLSAGVFEDDSLIAWFYYILPHKCVWLCHWAPGSPHTCAWTYSLLRWFPGPELSCAHKLLKPF